MNKFKVYRLECFGFYYFGYTSSIESRIKIHLSTLVSAVKNNRNKYIPFYTAVLEYAKKNSIPHNRIQYHFKWEVLREFNRKLRAIVYEEKFIQDSIEDANCKNVFVSHSCKVKGRECIKSIHSEDGLAIKPTFCVNCGHFLK